LGCRQGGNVLNAQDDIIQLILNAQGKCRFNAYIALKGSNKAENRRVKGGALAGVWGASSALPNQSPQGLIFYKKGEVK
jgi:hypothetical protein